MTITVELPMWLDETPIYWQNFIEHCNDKDIGIFSKYEVTMRSLAIKQALAAFNARYHQSSYNPMQRARLEFDSEKDYMMFILRWANK